MDTHARARARAPASARAPATGVIGVVLVVVQVVAILFHFGLPSLPPTRHPPHPHHHGIHQHNDNGPPPATRTEELMATTRRLINAVEFDAAVGGTNLGIVLTAHGNGSVVAVVVDDDVGTFGTMVHARREASLHGRETVDCRTLLGDRGNRMPELWARIVLEKCNSDDAKDVVFCFGVKKDFGRDASMEAGKALCEVLAQGIRDLRLPA